MRALEIDIVRRARRRYGPRRFQAFTIGAGKTGTHSMADMFRHYYRAAHEPDAAPLINLLARKLDGETVASDIPDFLAARDRQLGLEMDCSSLNSMLAKELAVEFPRAKFIITVRDCFSWANSTINQMLNNPSPSPHWQRWRTVIHGELATCRYAAGESALQQAGALSLDCYLRCWAAMYESALSGAPADRTLIVHTHRIGADVERLAKFLKAPAWTISADRSHSYKAAKNHELLAALDPDFVDERAQTICGDVMKQLYPDLPCELGTNYKQ